MAERPAPAEAPPLPGPDAALFLDFDGTLAEIAPTPDAVVVGPRLPALLARLAGLLGGGLAVVSGRPLDEIDRMLAPLRTAAAGLHGAEFRAAATAPVEVQARPADFAAAQGLLAEHARRHPGLLFEAKRCGGALHYRGAPEQEAGCLAAGHAAAALVPGAELLQGKMVVEVKPAGIDKGLAIERLLALPAFRGRRPFFAGDDVTDEAGFRTVNGLGGVSLRVGEGPSEAGFRIAGVAGLHAWLARAAERLAEGRAC